MKLFVVECRKLCRYFPTMETKYFVRRFFDNSGLMLEIHTDLDLETALKQTEKFEDDWRLDNLRLTTTHYLLMCCSRKNANLPMNFNK